MNWKTAPICAKYYAINRNGDGFWLENKPMGNTSDRFIFDGKFEFNERHLLTPFQLQNWPNAQGLLMEKPKQKDEDFLGMDTKTESPTSKYIVKITDRNGNTAHVDVYDVLKAFNVTNPATQHAIKKMLKPGQRGVKDVKQDINEAIISLTRALDLER
jgi:hypothetical protein